MGVVTKKGFVIRVFQEKSAFILPVVCHRKNVLTTIHGRSRLLEYGCKGQLYTGDQT
jgi:hypothetical protein